MRKFWPHQSRTTQPVFYLWNYSWSKHGKDYANLIYKLHPTLFVGDETQRNKALQVRYFQDTINFFKKINAQKIPANAYTKASLAKVLGIKSDQYKLLCTG
jgi:hypothetical protein